MTINANILKTQRRSSSFPSDESDALNIQNEKRGGMK